MDRKSLWTIFYEKPESPYRFRIGARVIKTVAAAFVCAAIGHFRGEPAFFSVLAAVICMQNTAEKTLVTSVNRTVGTILGGILGVLVLALAKELRLEQYMLLYYGVICLCLIPLIEATLAINKPSAATLACAVFLSITIVHIEDVSPMAHAMNRILDTLLGVAAALVINLAFPIRPPAEKRPESPPEKGAEAK